MRVFSIIPLLSFGLLPFPTTGLSQDPDIVEAETSIRLASTPALSPDGSKLAFSWAGDIWISGIRGGSARRVTSHPAADGAPIFSPDGNRIAFTSNRTGGDQVFTMPVKGGIPRQVTFHSEGSRTVEWYPDGKSILIRAQRDFGTRSAYRFFRISLEKREAETLLFDAEHGSGTAALSPDGKKLLFTREGGDLYRRGYRGTRASQIWLAENLESPKPKFTMMIARETGARSPMWKPDGSGFYYAGDHGESGLFSIWSYELKSGKEKELAKQKDDPAILPAISRDGSVIVYRSGFEFVRVRPTTEDAPEGRRKGKKKATRVQKISLHATGDITGESTFRRTLTKATNVSFSKDGLEMAFAAGGDIWIMDTELKEPIPITSTEAEEHEPVMSPDGKSVLFIRDDGETADIWSVERSRPESYWWQNREFKETRITKDGKKKHDLSFVPGGKRICYHSGAGDLWISDPDGKNAKLLIESWSALQYDWSPDGKWIAYAKSDSDFNRDIWIAPADGKRKPYNLSRHPDSDSNPKWSPNGKILAFTGRRFETETDIYYVYLSKADEEEDRRDRSLKSAVEKMAKERKKPAPKTPPAKDPFSTSTPKKEEQKKATDPAKPEPSHPKSKPKADPPKASPAKTEPSKTKPAAADPKPGKIETEPDKPNTSPPAATAEKKPPASSGPKPPEVKIDFGGIYDRIHRIAIPNSQEENLFWSHDSKRLAFGAKIRNVEGTYFVTFPDKLTTPSQLYSRRGALARWIPKNDTVLWLVNGVPASLTKGSLKSYSFKALQKFDRAEYRRVGFRQIWRTMGDIWYDPELNNLDWDAIGEKYEPAATKAADTRSFERAIAMMLGELNGSHLGFRASASALGESSWRPAGGWSESTVHLGMTFDRFFPGPGLKVASVVKRGPADQSDGNIEPGDVILEIDGVKVDPRTDLTQILNGPLERDISLTLSPIQKEKQDEDKEAKPEKPAEKESRTVKIRPASYSSIRTLMQRETINRNRRLVDQLSEGKIGYVYIPRMAWNEFIKFEEEIYARGAGKEGLIIDVRNNGGGFTADHLLTVLTPPEHAFTVPRGGERGYPQDRRVYATWNKPITVLCNQNSFSNAEIFSHAIKELDRGKLVGVTTSGGVISTGSKTIMDIGTLRIPFRGWFRLSDGKDMELNGAVPDVAVWPEPGELPRGKDRQIEKAITVLKKDIAAFRKKPKPDPKRASQR